MEKKQLFFSHTWRPDNLFRDNHKRVVKLAKIMSFYGWKCWIDENEIFGNIDACIASGIENCDVVLIFITESYCNKINEAAHNPNIRDNCLKEWTYANNRNKLMIPIIMEPCLLNTSYWPDGIINLYFGSTLYIDYSEDNIYNVVKNLTKLLNKYNIYCPSSNNTINNIYNNKVVKNIKALYFINKLKEKNKKKEINLLPPSPINGSPNITPNITPNVSNQSLYLLNNKSGEGSPLKKFIDNSVNNNNKFYLESLESKNNIITNDNIESLKKEIMNIKTSANKKFKEKKISNTKINNNNKFNISKNTILNNNKKNIRLLLRC